MWTALAAAAAVLILAGSAWLTTLGSGCNKVVRLEGVIAHVERSADAGGSIVLAVGSGSGSGRIVIVTVDEDGWFGVPTQILVSGRRQRLESLTAAMPAQVEARRDTCAPLRQDEVMRGIRVAVSA